MACRPWPICLILLIMSQRTLTKFPQLRFFVPVTVMYDAGHVLLQKKRPVQATNVLDVVCDAWLRLCVVAQVHVFSDVVDIQSIIYIVF